MKLIVTLITLWLVIAGVMAFDQDLLQLGAGVEQTGQRDGCAPQPAGIGDPLYVSPTLAAAATGLGRRPGAAADPIVLPNCHLAVIDTQDVPSQRDGVLLFIGTPVREGEQVSPDRLITIQAGSQVRQFRRLKEDDPVQAGQLLAQLDDRLARDDWAIKNSKIAAAKADLEAAEKTRDEAKNRFDTDLKMSRDGGGLTSQDVRGAKLTWERYVSEAVKAQEAVVLAGLERDQAQTVLEMHQIRSTISGTIKTIYKKPGEAVKNFEPVFQIQNVSRVQAEGLVDVQHLSQLHKGMRAVIQPSQVKAPEQTLVGHLQEITSVAVSNDPANPGIVSASEDGSVRIWDRSSRRESRVVRDPAAVRAVACTPPGVKANWCVSAGADGVARLWDLGSSALELVREFKGQHRGAVNCVALSPDGNSCASGGDDREICLWDLNSGELRYRLPPGHRGAITSLQFTPQAQLVSAGCDNTLRLWTLGRQGARLEMTMDRRSGDVPGLGVSRDGQHALFDLGKELRLLSLPDCLTEDVLQAPSGAANFTTFGQFSPDASLILTAGASEGRLQVWRTPTAATRGYELCQLVSAQRSPATCAAFAPDGSFIVTGTRDRQVLVWPAPAREEIERQLTAEVTLVEPSVESTAGQVRIRAELPNPDGRLLPGTTVTMMIYPGP